MGPAQSSGPPTQEQIDRILAGIVNVEAEVPTEDGNDSVPEPDGLMIVEPGAPERSFLMFKLDADGLTFCESLTCAADNACGTSMPQGSARWTDEERDIVRRWIAQGAENN
jgi:hypothetical protein